MAETSPPERRSDWRGALRAALPAAAVVLAALLVFWRAACLRGVFFHYDHAIQNYPFRLFFTHGLLPLWTPDIFCGFPLFAESQGGAAYPPYQVLFRLLPPWVAYNWYTILHFALAGVGAFALARVMRIGRAGALLAGIGYMLAGPVLYHAHHTNIIVGAAWLPWMLALAELACRRPSWPRLAALAAAVGMLILGAQPQYTLYVGLTTAIFLVWRFHTAELDGAPRGRSVRLLAALAAAGAVGLMLAAIQVVPLLELVGRTSRGGEGLPGISLSIPANLVTLMLPRYFGSPGLGSYWGRPDAGTYSEVTLFMGTALLLPALVGALTDRSRRALFFVGLGAFAFLFSLDRAGGIYSLFGHLPVFRAARFASRYAFVTALCVALLAGMGLEALVRAEDRKHVMRAAVLASAVVLALAALTLAVTAATQGGFVRMDRAHLAAALPGLPGYALDQVWRHLHGTLPADAVRLLLAALLGSALLLASARRALPARAVAAIWCIVVFAELAWAGGDFTAVTDPAIYTEPPPLVRALRELPPGRILQYGYNDFLRTGQSPADYPYTPGWALDPEAYAHSLDRLPPNSNMIWGLPGVNGFSPLQTVAFKTLLGRPDYTGTLIEFDLTPALRLLGARYILTPLESVPGGLKKLGKVGAVSIFEDPGAMPRAFVVHCGRASAADDEAARLLLAGGVDFAETVLVHDGGPVVFDPPGHDPADTAEVVEDSGDRIVVRAELARPGYLVLADQHYPGWQASVDGMPARLLRLDYLLKGVQLGAGRHEIVFTFRPASVRLGAAVSALGLLALLAAGVAWWWGRRHSAQPPQPDAEGAGLLERPYTVRTARLLALGALIFAALGPVTRPYLWTRAATRLTPRSLAANYVTIRCYYATADGGPVAGWQVLRDAVAWWPEHAGLRAELARAAAPAVAGLLATGTEADAAQARSVAAETLRLAPAEVRQSWPALATIAGRRRGETPHPTPITPP